MRVYVYVGVCVSVCMYVCVCVMCVYARVCVCVCKCVYVCEIILLTLICMHALCTCTPAAGGFTFGREVPVHICTMYMPNGRRPVYFRARSARVHAHRPQTGFLFARCRR